MKKIRGAVLLFITAFIWGGAFVAQDMGLEYVGPFTFTAIRFLMGGIFLFIVSVIVDLVKIKKLHVEYKKEEKKKKIKTTIKGGVLCGIVLFVGSNLQQIGIVYTTAGKCAFISAFYIVIVPIIGLVFKKKCDVTVYVAVAIALVGMYFLCLGEGFGKLNVGDAITFVSSFIFALHIITVDKFITECDGIKLSALQCLTCSVLSFILTAIFEKPTLSGITGAIMPLLFAGVMSAGIAYTFQILGQKDLNPTVASLIMSFESVAGALFSFIVLKQTMTTKEVIGCVITFIAVILAQIPIKGIIEKRRNIKKIRNI